MKRQQGVTAAAPRTVLQQHRSFDPDAVGALEAAAWAAYYRREWLRFGWAAVTLARRTFELSWPATIASSWLVLRANQLWAPFPDNRPGRAQRAMEGVYRIIQRQSGERFDPVVAAALEVKWWGVHRDMHHTRMADGEHALIEAVASLYGYVYGVPTASVRLAASHRALAMRHTDRWVEGGCQADSPLLDESRQALVRSYAALLDAIQTHQHDLPERAQSSGRLTRRALATPVAGAAGSGAA